MPIDTWSWVRHRCCSSTKVRSGWASIQPLEPAIMLVQTGTPITADLFGEALAGRQCSSPKSFDTFAADTKAFADIAGAFTAFPRSNDPLPQILTQGAHMSFLMPEEYHRCTKCVYLNRKCSKTKIPRPFLPAPQSIWVLRSSREFARIPSRPPPEKFRARED